MEFQYRSGDPRQPDYLLQHSSLGYLPQQAIPAGYEMNTDATYPLNPSSSNLEQALMQGRNHSHEAIHHDALQRQLEKQRIREEIIAAEIERRRILEAEVRRELMMEQQMTMHRSFGGYPIEGRPSGWFDERFSFVDRIDNQPTEEPWTFSGPARERFSFIDRIDSQPTEEHWDFSGAARYNRFSSSYPAIPYPEDILPRVNSTPNESLPHMRPKVNSVPHESLPYMRPEVNSVPHESVPYMRAEVNSVHHESLQYMRPEVNSVPHELLQYMRPEVNSVPNESLQYVRPEIPLATNKLLPHIRPEISLAPNMSRPYPEATGAGIGSTSNERRFIILDKPKKNAAGMKRKAPAPLKKTGGDLTKKKKLDGEWSCALCHVSATSEQGLNDHLRGKKHKAMEETLRSKNDSKEASKSKHQKGKRVLGSETINKEGPFPERKCDLKKTTASEKKVEGELEKAEKPKRNQKFKFWCGVCRVGAHSSVVMEAHYKGKKHFLNLEQKGEASAPASASASASAAAPVAGTSK